MWVCHCNPFSDKDVRKCLDGKKGESARVSEVYKCCSGGNKPNCASCIPFLQELVMDHNRDVAVADLRKSVEEHAPCEKVASGSVRRTAEKTDPAL